MSGSILCNTHGYSRRTRVCTHVVDGLELRVGRGFHWYATNGVPDEARCSACEEASIRMTAEAWEAYSSPFVVALCWGCYCDAAAMNDVELPES